MGKGYYSVKERMQFKRLSQKLAAFGFGQLQDTLGILIKLKKIDISSEEFITWVRYLKSGNTSATHVRTRRVPINEEYVCPHCDMPLILDEVNSMACAMVGGVYQSLFTCFDQRDCGYELYSANPISYWEELSNLIGKKRAVLYSLRAFERVEEINKLESSGDVKVVNGGCGGCGKK